MEKREPKKVGGILAGWMRESPQAKEGILGALASQAFLDIVGPLAPQLGDLFCRSHTLFVEVHSSALRHYLEENKSELIAKVNAQLPESFISTMRFF